MEQKEEKSVAGKGQETVVESLLSAKPSLEFSEGRENGLERREGRMSTEEMFEAEQPLGGVLPQPLLSKSECYCPVLCVYVCHTSTAHAAVAVSGGEEEARPIPPPRLKRGKKKMQKPASLENINVSSEPHTLPFTLTHAL